MHDAERIRHLREAIAGPLGTLERRAAVEELAELEHRTAPTSAGSDAAHLDAARAAYAIAHTPEQYEKAGRELTAAERIRARREARAAVMGDELIPVDMRPVIEGEPYLAPHLRSDATVSGDDTAGTEEHNQRAELEEEPAPPHAGDLERLDTHQLEQAAARAESYAEHNADRYPETAAHQRRAAGEYRAELERRQAAALESLQFQPDDDDDPRLIAAVADLEELAGLAVSPLWNEERRLAHRLENLETRKRMGKPAALESTRQQLERVRRALELARRHDLKRRAILEKLERSDG